MHKIQFTILITYYAALSVETGTMVNFGLEGARLGAFLIITNLVIFVLALYFACVKFGKLRHLKEDKEWKVDTFFSFCCWQMLHTSI